MDALIKTRIGIMGGTFDPIHYGHLFIAECSRQKFDLNKVLFIPSGMPVHKKRPDIQPPEHRLEMTRLAIRDNPKFELSTIEIDRPGPTYTVDTLEVLHSINNHTQEYFFITGADAIMEILTWKDVDKVLELCHFIAVTRPGHSLDEINRVIQSFSETQRSRFHIYETVGILVSSTEVRERVFLNEPIRYLVPDDVEKYISANRMYRQQVSQDWV
ncbi:MAG TPA: nicotinate-nucleotide adenylyltransferase [Desulfobacteria bacterium]|nr:nicotinate-nucleotide adenylyltransferase [Desulfobacteria bacterium]